MARRWSGPQQTPVIKEMMVLNQFPILWGPHLATIHTLEMLQVRHNMFQNSRILQMVERVL